MFCKKIAVDTRQSTGRLFFYAYILHLKFFYFIMSLNRRMAYTRGAKIMKIGFIGCGNMGSAMIGGILKKGVFTKDEIIVSNLTEEGSERSREKLGVTTTMDNCEVVKNANIVILAVKPQFYEEVISQIKGCLTPDHMIVGIAPGKTLAWLEEKCEQPLKVVRLMPNTPAQVGEGMTGACANDRVTKEDMDQILAITNSFGRT